MTMAPRTIPALRPEVMAEQTTTTRTECRESRAEGDAHGTGWARRRERLLRRLEQAMLGTPLAAQSAWAVVAGMQRARALADEMGREGAVTAEAGGGEDALMLLECDADGTDNRPANDHGPHRACSSDERKE